MPVALASRPQPIRPKKISRLALYFWA